MLGNKEKDKIVKRYGDYYWEQIKKLSESYDKDLEERAREIEQKDKRIAELEQELAKYKDLQDRLGLENVDEFEWFVMLDLLTDNEKNMHILDLHRELAELKENAIVPRFKFDEECVVIMFGSYHFHRFIAQVKDDLCLTQPYNDTEEWYYVKPEMVFKTLEEAQAKLKEIQENE